MNSFKSKGPTSAKTKRRKHNRAKNFCIDDFSSETCKLGVIINVVNSKNPCIVDLQTDKYIQCRRRASVSGRSIIVSAPVIFSFTTSENTHGEVVFVLSTDDLECACTKFRVDYGKAARATNIATSVSRKAAIRTEKINYNKASTNYELDTDSMCVPLSAIDKDQSNESESESENENENESASGEEAENKNKIKIKNEEYDSDKETENFYASLGYNLSELNRANGAKTLPTNKNNWRDSSHKKNKSKTGTEHTPITFAKVQPTCNDGEKPLVEHDIDNI